MTEPLPSGAVIGILGGGQLGRMLSVAASARLPHHIFEPGAAPPPPRSAAWTQAGYDDLDALAPSPGPRCHHL
jgi:5-(carboxyamino)imidazole ribonucleotide synthase